MKDVNILTSNGVNVQKSLELFGDMATYDETLTDWMNEVGEKLANIKKYKENADMANYAILVHSLKSDAKYFGFEKLAELAYQHELESKANNMYYVYENYDALVAEANRIIQVVNQYNGNESSVTATDAVPTIKDKTILVVDDSNIINKFIQNIFHNTFEVLTAMDGQEAINIVTTDTTGKIKGMLLDLNMPNVDGFQVLEYFKANNLFAKIPVCIITGDGSRDVINRAFTYPVVDVLEKPFNENNIKRVIDKITTYNK